MPSFSAVLLAGGKSTRMGRDKALLPVPNSNLLLWQRQLRVLEELRPDEIFWSGPPRPGLPDGLRIVADEVSDAGPLAGICACLNLMSSDLLVVLAIDLPQMSSSFLTDLQGKCSSNRGVVLRHGDFFEPLAAIYPKRIHPLAREHLSQGRYSLQDLLQEAIKQNLIQAFDATKKHSALFQNWNAPTADATAIKAD
jgi:molybdopterin-guanine dinucleotide biosynthesis protein A